MSTTATLAEAFPPGEYIKDELAARGWTQEDLAQVVGRPIQAINEIINGKKTITPATAIELGAAFDTSSEMWLNLQNQWLLHKAASKGGSGDAARRRARLRDRLPVNDMVKRGWLPDTRDVEELEAAVCKLIGVSSPDEELPFQAAARRRGRGPDWTPKQTAWLCRVNFLAKEMTVVAPYDRDVATREIPNLAHMSVHPEDMSSLPNRLAQLGIRFVLEAPLRKRPAQSVGRPLACPAAGQGLVAVVEQPLHEGAGGQHDRSGAVHGVAAHTHAQHAAAAPVRLDQQLLGRFLSQGQPGLVFQRPLDFLLIRPLVGLRAGAVHGGAFASIEQAELDAGGVDRPAHGPAQGVDLADDMPLGHAADGRIAAHLRNRVEVRGQHRRLSAHARRRERSLRARVPSADHHDVVVVLCCAHTIHDRDQPIRGEGPAGRSPRA